MQTHLKPYFLSFLHALVVVGWQTVGGIAAATAPWFGAMVEVVIGGGHVEVVVSILHIVYLCNGNC